MPKANNIVSTAHAQHAEMAALLGGAAAPAKVVASPELVDAYQALQEDFDALKASNAALVEEHSAAGDEIDRLTAALAEEKAAHEATQAALTAATATKSE